MSTAPTRTRKRFPGTRLAANAVLLAFAGAAHGQAPAASTPVGLPAHPMLEDPFNRSLLFDELETHEHDGSRDLAWDATFWAGRAFDKLLVRTEGEKNGGITEDAELELLWSHTVTRWWDVVAGARTDFEPGSTQSWAAFGIRGLAPQRFELEATAYVGDGGQSAARFEGEYELLITPRLILQPQLELNWYGQADAARGIGSGFSTAEAGLRLRYEFRREVAPYVGLVRERKFGATADRARAEGEDADDTRLVAGVRLRF
jgi:copper resistance protein B